MLHYEWEVANGPVERALGELVAATLGQGGCEVDFVPPAEESETSPRLVVAVAELWSDGGAYRLRVTVDVVLSLFPPGAVEPTWSRRVFCEGASTSVVDDRTSHAYNRAVIEWDELMAGALFSRGFVDALATVERPR